MTVATDRWVTLALVTLAHTLGAISVLSVAPLSPFLVDGLGISRAQVGLLLPAVYLGGVAMSLPAGWLTDRLGARSTLILGQAVTGSMLVLGALSGTFLGLLAMLCVGGFGWSVVNPATGRAIVEQFPPHQRGMAMGVKQTGLTLGGVAASLILPPIAVAGGWRRAFAIAAACSLLSVLVVAVVYRTRSQPVPAEAPGRPRLIELQPFLQRPAYLVVFACGLLFSVVQASVLSYLVLYAKEEFDYSVVAAGQVLALAQLGGTAARLGWGVVSDRVFEGRRRPGLVINALLGAFVYLSFGLVPLTFGLAVPPLALLAGAAGFGWMGLYLALVAEIGGMRYAGLLTGVAVSFAWSGVLIGPPIFGVILDGTRSYRIPWLVLAAIEVCVAIALHRVPPLVSRRGGSPSPERPLS